MTTELAIAAPLPAVTSRGRAMLRELERVNLSLEQVEIETRHLIHGGMYARSITLPAGTVLTGALIKVATILVMFGDAEISIGEESRRLSGFHVIPGAAGRMQAFVAHAETDLTMIFPSSAKDVEAAELEFTDDAERLFSRRWPNVVTITGE